MEEDKDIKILEEFIEEYNASYPEEKEWVVIYPNQIQSLQNLIARYKELEEEKKDLQKYIKDYLIPKSTINLVYTPKSKVKEIIQENSINISGFWCIPTEDLQELLED